MQHCLMDLGQGGGPHRGVIKAHKQIMDLSRVEREDGTIKMTEFSERGQEDRPDLCCLMPHHTDFLLCQLYATEIHTRHMEGVRQKNTLESVFSHVYKGALSTSI